jgi:hypothetical protein
MAKELGPEFEKYKYGSLYQGLRYVLFYKGFMISIGTHRDGDKVFIIREKMEGDKLAPTYRELEKRANIIEEKKIKRESEETFQEIQKQREDLLNEKAVLEEKSRQLRKEREEMFLEISKQREALRIDKAVLEEARKEKEDIEKLEQKLIEKFGNKIYMAEIFQFNWKTLAWKLIKRKSIKNHMHLIDLITEYTSAIEVRYRFELTPIYETGKTGPIELEKFREGEGGVKEEETESGVKEEETEGGIKEGEVKEGEVKEGGVTEGEVKEGEVKEGEVKEGEVKEGGVKEGGVKEEIEIECPRCGSKNIKTWPTIKIIRTRAGERRLRHRCVDCNETFGDEDIVSTFQEIKVVEE